MHIVTYDDMYVITSRSMARKKKTGTRRSSNESKVRKQTQKGKPVWLAPKRKECIRPRKHKGSFIISDYKTGIQNSTCGSRKTHKWICAVGSYQDQSGSGLMWHCDFLPPKTICHACWDTNVTEKETCFLYFLSSHLFASHKSRD